MQLFQSVCVGGGRFYHMWNILLDNYNQQIKHIIYVANLCFFYRLSRTPDLGGRPNLLTPQPDTGLFSRTKSAQL